MAVAFKVGDWVEMKEVSPSTFVIGSYRVNAVYRSYGKLCCWLDIPSCVDAREYRPGIGYPIWASVLKLSPRSLRKRWL